MWYLLGLIAMLLTVLGLIILLCWMNFDLGGVDCAGVGHFWDVLTCLLWLCLLGMFTLTIGL